MKNKIIKIATLIILIAGFALPTVFADFESVLAPSPITGKDPLEPSGLDPATTPKIDGLSGIQNFKDIDAAQQKAADEKLIQDMGNEALNEVMLEDEMAAKAAEEKGNLKSMQFDVGKFLSLPGNDQKQSYFKNPVNGSPITSFAISVLNFAVQIIGTIAIIILIIGGFMILFAQGDQQKLSEAKDLVKYAVIGLIVTFLSYIIVIFIQSLFTTPDTEFPKNNSIQNTSK